ncbi:MAG: sulfite exporter TauE/SafE family protein [Verrucomicrobiales bacterium]
MIDAAGVNTVAAAFMAGLVTSVHCAGMCGPVACLAGTGSSGQASAALYHAGRAISYTTIGAFAGVVGKEPVQALFDSPFVVLPWVLVFVLVGIGLGLNKFMPKVPALGSWVFRSRLRVMELPSTWRAGALGILTPLFPCAPLYMMFGVALVSGSAVAGAQFTFAFALGTIPLLWLAQQSVQWLGLRLSPQRMMIGQRTLALITAGVLAWRLKDTLWFMETASGAVSCPLCQ